MLSSLRPIADPGQARNRVCSQGTRKRACSGHQCRGRRYSCQSSRPSRVPGRHGTCGAQGRAGRGVKVGVGVTLSACWDLTTGVEEADTGAAGRAGLVGCSMSSGCKKGQGTSRTRASINVKAMAKRETSEATECVSWYIRPHSSYRATQETTHSRPRYAFCMTMQQERALGGLQFFHRTTSQGMATALIQHGQSIVQRRLVGDAISLPFSPPDPDRSHGHPGRAPRAEAPPVAPLPPRRLPSWAHTRGPYPS